MIGGGSVARSIGIAPPALATAKPAGLAADRDQHHRQVAGGRRAVALEQGAAARVAAQAEHGRRAGRAEFERRLLLLQAGAPGAERDLVLVALAVRTAIDRMRGLVADRR